MRDPRLREREERCMRKVLAFIFGFGFLLLIQKINTNFI